MKRELCVKLVIYKDYFILSSVLLLNLHYHNIDFSSPKYADDIGSKFVSDVSTLLHDYTSPHPKRP